MDRAFGALLLCGITYLMGIGLFFGFVKSFNEKRKRYWMLFMSLTAPFYSLYVLTILPLRFFEMNEIVQARIIQVFWIYSIFFGVMCANAFFIHRNRDEKLTLLCAVLSLVWFPLMNISASYKSSVEEFYNFSVLEYMKVNNLLSIILALTYCGLVIIAIIQLIRDDHWDLKNRSSQDKLYYILRLAILVIFIYGVLFFLFHIIDYVNYSAIKKGYFESRIENFGYASGIETLFESSGSIIESFINSIYFSLITFTTVGYGDIYPSSVYTRIIVSLEVISMFFIVFLGINLYLTKDDDTRSQKE